MICLWLCKGKNLQNLIGWTPFPSPGLGPWSEKRWSSPRKLREVKWFTWGHMANLCPNPEASDSLPRSTLDASHMLSCFQFSWVQSLSRVQLFATPLDYSTPGFPVHHQLPELAQTHVHRVSDATQSSHPLSTPSPPVFNLAQHQGLFQSVLHIRWPKYWSFSFSSSKEYSGLISFRIDWFDLLAVQGTVKNLSQHHSSKALILWHSAFFI